MAAAAATAAATLFGSYMANRSNKRGMDQQQKANDAALEFEKKKYAEQQAWQNAIRAAWAKRHGIDWQPGQSWPPGGGGGAPGAPGAPPGGGGLPKTTLLPPQAAKLPSIGRAQGRPPLPEEEEEMPAAAWNQW
jgi:hypothetical protein